MNYKSRRSRACAIPEDVKQKVCERDGGSCIFCGKPGGPVAHVIPRSHGGLGIEQNIVTACIVCHELMDNSIYRPAFIDAAERHLRGVYGDEAMEEIDRMYRKGTK